jgi:V/A-type H+-transporting ATPase subunit I
VIVPMKKVVVVCMAADQAGCLDALQELGVVHAVHSREPVSDDLQSVRRARGLVRAGAALLAAAAPARAGTLAPAAGRAALAADDVARLALEVAQRRKQIEERIRMLRDEKRELEPFGSFDPASVRELFSQGICVRLYRNSTGKTPALPEGVSMRRLHKDKSAEYFVLFGQGDFDFPLAPCPLPSRALCDVYSELQKAEASLEAAGAELAGLAIHARALLNEADRLDARVRYLETRDGMGAAHQLTYLEGFCPVPKVDSLRAAAARHGWGLLALDPDEAETVPTLIDAPRWTRPVMAIFRMLGILPGYREVDVSAVFLIFFSIFFAMLIGDAGYGVLYLALTVWLARKWKAAPPNLVPLLGILSVATIVWGVLTGTYFSIQSLPAPLKSLRLDWLTDARHIESLCFFLGSVHITVAHAWNVILQRRRLTAVAQGGWILLTWTMYFMACYLVLGTPVPGFVPWMAIAGFIAVLVFMTPFAHIGKEWPNYIMLPLSIVGNFGDVVSYLRLYLVGSASTTLILAFNELVLGKGISSFGAGLMAALVIFGAHVLNIVLGALAVLVHGIRLNALEFSSHLGIQWAGVEYKPFARDAVAGKPS